MNIFKRKNKENDLMDKTSKGSTRTSSIMDVLQKLGRGLMLPISVLPFAGILLGIGGAIGANVHTEGGIIAAGIFKGMSEVIFGNLPVLFTIAIAITFTGESGAAALMAVIGYLVFSASQTVFIHANEDGYTDILWFHNIKDDVGLQSLVAKNLGIVSLQTSLFGGIIIGFLTSYIYNKMKFIQLPNPISFFSGVRSIPFILIPVSFIIALLFLIFWPWVGQGINLIGEGISKTPAGIDGLIYGMAGRALMPFGLHTILITLAFQTPFGGVLYLSQIESLQPIINDQNEYLALLEGFKSFANGQTQILGDQNIWNYLNSVSVNTINGEYLFSFFKENLNINAGRFTQDYPTYLGVCTAIGLAFIFTSDKDGRKNTTAVIGSAMFVAFLTGITEPLEFTFLFISPILYYAIYVPFSGLSYMFMELVGAHIGVGFARGFIDLIIYGAMPMAKGTNFYWAFIFAIVEGAAIFPIFYFSIKKWDIQTPGRGGNQVLLINKKDYNNLKSNNGKSEANKLIQDERLNDVLDALGGIENIISVTSCATRLRTKVVEANLVDKERLKELGASGTIIKGESIQVIFGGEAVVLSEKINSILI